MDEISKFIADQLSVWPLAAANFRSLKHTEQRSLEVDGLTVRLQFNPQRIISTTAEVDPKTISERKCFLCQDGRPKEQFHIKFDGRKRRRYNIQVNPYPIFPSHLVLARDIHTPQSIWHYFVDMLDFARKYPQFLVFYNGPKSGASAPDHMHYQACPLGSMPLQLSADEFLKAPGNPLTTNQDARLYHYPHFCRGVYVLAAKTPKSLAKLFYRLADSAPLHTGDDEPRLNMFTYIAEDEYRCIVVLRSESRSHHYYSTGADHLLMSPGAADMAGVLICPCREDYDKLTPELIRSMVAEVTISPQEEDMVAWRLTRTQPKLQVKILSAPQITFEIISDGAGPQTVSLREGRIDYGGELFDELYFDARTRSTVFAEPSFILYSPKMLFGGALKFAVENGELCAYNYIGIENYLLGVFSNMQDLPAEQELFHAVIDSRKALMEDRSSAKPYPGLTNGIRKEVKKAVDRTWGKLSWEDD